MSLQRRSRDLLAQAHVKSLEPILKRWNSGFLPGALLFLGAPGSGQRELARYLAQWIHCTLAKTQPELFQPCGECANCKRIEAQQWPDFVEVSSRGEDGRPTSLKLDQIRELSEQARFGPAQEGATKFILIPEAELLTQQAGNALLKILEEPPRGWTFILVAPDESSILPTLVSRCQRVRFAPLRESLLKEILQVQQVQPERIATSVSLAVGNLFRALELAEDSTWEELPRVLKFLKAPTRELNSLVDWAAQDAFKLELVLAQLEIYAHDLLQWICETDFQAWSDKNAEKVLLEFGENSLKKVGDREQLRQKWFDSYEQLSKVRAQAHLPLNRKLLAQNALGAWLS